MFVLLCLAMYETTAVRVLKVVHLPAKLAPFPPFRICYCIFVNFGPLKRWKKKEKAKHDSCKVQKLLLSLFRKQIYLEDPTLFKGITTAKPMISLTLSDFT